MPYLPTVAIVHPASSSTTPRVKALQAFHRQRLVTLARTTCTFQWAPWGWYPRLGCGATDSLRRTVQFAPINAPWCMIMPMSHLKHGEEYMKFGVVWDVTPCSLVQQYQSFCVTRCRHISGSSQNWSSGLQGQVGSGSNISVLCLGVTWFESRR